MNAPLLQITLPLGSVAGAPGAADPARAATDHRAGALDGVFALLLGTLLPVARPTPADGIVQIDGPAPLVPAPLGHGAPGRESLPAAGTAAPATALHGLSGAPGGSGPGDASADPGPAAPARADRSVPPPSPGASPPPAIAPTVPIPGLGDAQLPGSAPGLPDTGAPRDLPARPGGFPQPALAVLPAAAPAVAARPQGSVPGAAVAAGPPAAAPASPEAPGRSPVAPPDGRAPAGSGGGAPQPSPEVRPTLPVAPDSSFMDELPELPVQVHDGPARLDRPAPEPATSRVAPPAPAVQLGVQIAAAGQQRIERLFVQLEPAELGRVEVRLEFTQDHRITAVIAADRPETLDLLQRDSRGLERSLQDAGLRLGADGLSFSLRQEHRGERHAGLPGPLHPPGAGLPDPAAARDDPAPVRWIGSRRLLDIHI